MEYALSLEHEARTHLSNLNLALSARGSQVQTYYSGAVVFLTGGSGYLGKQLLEKLFRSCDVRKTYLLLRPKKGKSIEDRLNEILEDPGYSSLFASQPNFKQRIVPVAGDVESLQLGVSDEIWKDLTDNVTMIFHVAATVKFDEGLRRAVRTNVRGTREMLQLAHSCKLLKSVVYVSTAYSHVTSSRLHAELREEFYPSPVEPSVLIDMVDTFSDDKLKEISPKLTSGWPNTYSFTKAVAEECVRTFGADLPVCIVRPAIVIGAYREPLPGWIDPRCVYGANGIGLSCILGILHVILCGRDVSVNLVPVDYVNNAILVAGRRAGERWGEGEREIFIYNVTCDRTFTWGDCVAHFNKMLNKFPSPNVVGDCFAFHTPDSITYYVLVAVMHYVPAAIMDVLSVLLGKKPRMINIYNRIHQLSQVTKYFTINNWLFDDKNTQALYHDLSKTDRFIFNFDRNTLDIPKMMILWSLGLRRFVLKDELKGTETGLRRQMMFKLASVFLLFAYVYGLVWFVRVFGRLFEIKL